MGVHDEDLVWLAARVRELRTHAGSSREQGSTAAGVGAQPAGACRADEAEKDLQLMAATIGVAAAPDSNAFVAPRSDADGRTV